MAKKNIGAHPAVSPIPAFMVSCADKEGNSDIITISYGGIVSANPPMVYISVRDTRYSYPMLKEVNDFVINIPSEDQAKETDYCGITTGQDGARYPLHLHRFPDVGHGGLGINRPSDFEKLSSDKRLAWRALSTLGAQLPLMDPSLSVEMICLYVLQEKKKRETMHKSPVRNSNTAIILGFFIKNPF